MTFNQKLVFDIHRLFIFTFSRGIFSSIMISVAPSLTSISSNQVTWKSCRGSD